jgi:hypothetical protein
MSGRRIAPAVNIASAAWHGVIDLAALTTRTTVWSGVYKLKNLNIVSDQVLAHEHAQDKYSTAPATSTSN